VVHAVRDVRVAVISDIHSNLPALAAVLADIDEQDPSPDGLWCLGDIVGYGAAPDACAALTANLTDVCLAGNHDLVVSGGLDIRHFTTAAEAAARWTMDTISPLTRDYLATLEPLEGGQPTGLYHASPRDPIWEYVLSIDQAHDCLTAQRERVCLIGHSHVACHFSRDDGRPTEGAMAPAGTVLEMPEGEWLVNPGSVGQPRDGDPRASYLMLDTDEWRAVFHRVEYPIHQAASAIVEAELPRQLADRLYVGQ
jgi:predicted phosphodiesterase